MKTTSVFALIAIIAALGIMATATIGTGMVFQQASAASSHLNTCSGEYKSSNFKSFEQANHRSLHFDFDC